MTARLPLVIQGTQIEEIQSGDTYNLTNGASLPLSTGVTGTLPIANGGTGATTAPSALNSLMKYTTTATAAGTTTLTSSSTFYQYFTGTNTQTIVMPVTTTLALGWSYKIVNNSTGTITVNSSGANAIGTITSGISATITCILASGTSAASWHLEYESFDAVTGTGSNVLATSPTLVTPNLGTPSAVVLTSATGLPLTTGVTGTLPVANGGTGVTTSTGSGANVLDTTPTLSNPTVTNYTETAYTANTSTAITVSLSNGTVQILTLTANATITMPTAGAGKSFIIILRQDATGSRTVTWTTVNWAGGTAPTITSTASKQDIFSFFSDGTSWYGVTVGQNYTA